MRPPNRPARSIDSVISCSCVTTERAAELCCRLAEQSRAHAIICSCWAFVISKHCALFGIVSCCLLLVAAPEGCLCGVSSLAAKQIYWLMPVSFGLGFVCLGSNKTAINKGSYTHNGTVPAPNHNDLLSRRWKYISKPINIVKSHPMQPSLHQSLCHSHSLSKSQSILLASADFVFELSAQFSICLQHLPRITHSKQYKVHYLAINLFWHV